MTDSVETLSSSGVASENKTIHIPPPSSLLPPLHSKLELWFSTSSLNSGKTLHGGLGEGKLYFLLCKVATFGKVSQLILSLIAGNDMLLVLIAFCFTTVACLVVHSLEDTLLISCFSS